MEDPNRVGNVYLRAQLVIGMPCILSQDRDWHEIIPETIGQSTGKKDKNGVKIFEGDIVLYKGIKLPVRWDDEKAGFFYWQRQILDDE